MKIFWRETRRSWDKCSICEDKEINIEEKGEGDNLSIIIFKIRTYVIIILVQSIITLSYIFFMPLFKTTFHNLFRK